MKGSFNDSPLQIIAAQVASLRANETAKSFPARVASRLQQELLHGSLRKRLGFVKYAARESLVRLWTRMRAPRRETSVDVPQDRLLVIARCNGGMGDLVIYSALLDRFFKECGHPVVHVVVPTLRLEEAAFVFHNSPAVALVTDAADLRPESTPYDVVITLGDFASYDFIRSERVERIAPQVLEKLTAAREIQRPYRALIDVQPLYDGLFTTFAAQLGLRRLDLLGWLANVRFSQEHQLGTCPEAEGYRRFEELGFAQRPYITIHNGWDNVAHRHTKNATKGWPPSHYERFVAAFKQRHPQVLVVQLGAKTSQPIAGADIGLLDDTTLHEAAWILKHSLLHVDGDSGLVHLARALHTKSLVLFGPTNHEFFRYAQNETCFSTTCSNCWWSTRDWMRSCPRGLREPECMKSIEPADVLDLADKHLRSLPSRRVAVEDSRYWQPPVPVTAQEENRPQETEDLSQNPAGRTEVGRNSGLAEDSNRGSGIGSNFDAWRGRLVLDALRSAGDGEARLLVAILDKGGWPSSQLAATGHKISTFAFKTDHVRLSSPGAASGPNLTDEGVGKIAWDYGSLYNIPEEDNAFDAVIMPLVTDRIQYPYPAVKESLRVLKEDGLLVIAYRFAGGDVRDSKGWRDHPSHAFFQALEDLGAAGRLAPSAAGGIVLRKSSSGHLFTERLSRANKRIGV